jgi:hypothetical protein
MEKLQDEAFRKQGADKDIRPLEKNRRMEKTERWGVLCFVFISK